MLIPVILWVNENGSFGTKTPSLCPNAYRLGFSLYAVPFVDCFIRCLDYEYTEICSTTEGITVACFICEATQIQVVTFIVCFARSFIQILAATVTVQTCFHSFPQYFQASAIIWGFPRMILCNPPEFSLTEPRQWPRHLSARNSKHLVYIVLKFNITLNICAVNHKKKCWKQCCNACREGSRIVNM